MMVRTCKASCKCICHTYEMADIVMGGGLPQCCHTDDPFAETKSVLKNRMMARRQVRSTPNYKRCVVVIRASLNYYVYGKDSHLELTRDKSLALRLTRPEAEEVRSRYSGGVTPVEIELVV